MEKLDRGKRALVIYYCIYSDYSIITTLSKQENNCPSCRLKYKSTDFLRLLTGSHPEAHTRWPSGPSANQSSDD